MNKILQLLIILILTILTQTGGLIYILSRVLALKWFPNKKSPLIAIFLSLYLSSTFILLPFLAPIFGREPIKHSSRIQPTSYMTVLLNRNYVRPELNTLLSKLEQRLKKTTIPINYLDANFPFINKFPLLPHLSHNDGRKLDLSLIYESPKGLISPLQKSRSGYGIFVSPQANEVHQTDKCFAKGYYQYDYPKYLSFGQKNSALRFSKKGTKKLLRAILKEKSLQKIFIEPHLKNRLNIRDKRIRFQGCRAVRHDDHIHLQIH